jgi:hypothetical protein
MAKIKLITFKEILEAFLGKIRGMVKSKDKKERSLKQLVC